MRRGEALEIRPARHRAVLIEDLDDHGRRLEPGEACEVAAGLGVAGAGQHAARPRHQRKDVAGLAQVLGACAGCDRSAHGMRAVLRRDAGRDAFRGLDADGEVRAMASRRRR